MLTGSIDHPDLLCVFPDVADHPDYKVYYWIGWKPDPSQPKPLKPQTSDVSYKFYIQLLLQI